jgi:hypothetical protein
MSVPPTKETMQAATARVEIAASLANLIFRR